MGVVRPVVLSLFRMRFAPGDFVGGGRYTYDEQTQIDHRRGICSRTECCRKGQEG
jgi:hypothetical protein